MLPNANVDNIDDLIRELTEEEQENTQTFDIYELEHPVLMTSTGNVVTHAVSGKIDELEALKQAIYLILNVEADQFIIYPYTYGIQVLDLIGKPSYYVVAVVQERIKEALVDDDRITDVTDFEFNIQKNKITVTFIVHSIYGDIEEETVVTY